MTYYRRHGDSDDYQWYYEILWDDLLNISFVCSTVVLLIQAGSPSLSASPLPSLVHLRNIIKGTHTVYFSSSLYIINEKPMIPRTHFLLYKPHGLHALLGEIRPCICLFLWFRFSSQMVLLSNINIYIDCKIRLCLIVPGRQEKIYFCTIKFLQGILDDINEQDTFS